MATLRSYGFAGTIRLVSDILLTRILFRGARIVRRPYRLRGRAHIAFGMRLTVGIGLRIEAFPNAFADSPIVRIGDDVEINDHVHLAAVNSLIIGSRSLIASGVFISDHNHGDLDGPTAQNGPSIPPAMRPLAARPVRIGDDVWIGQHAVILPGVVIGNGAIVGAGAVVTRDVPAGAVVAGAPARILRLFDRASGCWTRTA